MTQFNQPHSQNSFSREKKSESLSREKDKLATAVKECQTQQTCKYITLNGKPYLITPEGVIAYEGSLTTAYTKSIKKKKI
jgi:hypothetical protein